MNPKCRQERLVFVDPEDEEISYWWPAIVVTEDEYELFKETMTNDDEASFSVGELERLVCYFEDGSFSVVPKSGLIPFNPSREPFKSYSMRLKHFSSDSGVRSAVAFHQQGVIPKIFKWLILSETGYLDIIDDKRDGEENENENTMITSTETEIKNKVKREQKLELQKKKSKSKSSMSVENLQIEKDKFKAKDDTSTLPLPLKTKTYNKHNHKVKPEKNKNKNKEEKSRRGRKPKPRPESEQFNETKPKSKTKNETGSESEGGINLLNNNNNFNINNNNNNQMIPSPTPLNPSEMNKIEALLSAAAMVANVPVTQTQTQ